MTAPGRGSSEPWAAVRRTDIDKRPGRAAYLRWCAVGVVIAAALLGAAIGDGRTEQAGGPSPATQWPVEASGADIDGVPAAASTFGWVGPVWADEFEGRALAPDWALYDSPGHDDNGLRRPSQATVAGGVLTQAGTSGALSAGTLRRGVGARYGRWEVRARADQRGAGSRPYHAVIALIPVSIPYNAGERDIDFLEADIGTGEVNLFVHYPPLKQDYLSIPLDLAGWHTFAVEVAPDHVTWFVDGEVRATTTRASAIPKAPLTLNVQLDAYQPGDLVPGRLQVDWARFYALPKPAPPALPGPAPAQGDYNPGR